MKTNSPSFCSIWFPLEKKSAGCIVVQIIWYILFLTFEEFRNKYNWFFVSTCKKLWPSGWQLAFYRMSNKAELPLSMEICTVVTFLALCQVWENKGKGIFWFLSQCFKSFGLWLILPIIFFSLGPAFWICLCHSMSFLI